MSDLQALIDMGFYKEQAQLALDKTNNTGVESALEWLFANSAPSSGDAALGAVVPTPNQPTESIEKKSEAEASAETEAGAEAKSLKCEDCNRLFKTQMEVEFHAVKSGHSNFSESTEEKKPLTEDEKKEQLARLEEKLRQKRLEREEREKQEALEKEKNRIRSGKDLLSAQQKVEEMEMKKLVEQRKREKQEDKLARERVRAQIEADKLARKANLQGKQAPDAVPTPAPAPAPAPAPTTSTVSAPKNYIHTRIQVRLQDGSTLVETFDVKEQLAAVRLFIQMKQGAQETFDLMTSFPRKVFTADDYEETLQSLGLVPSAVLIVTKVK